MINKMQK